MQMMFLRRVVRCCACACFTLSACTDSDDLSLEDRSAPIEIVDDFTVYLGDAEVEIDGRSLIVVSDDSFRATQQPYRDEPDVITCGCNADCGQDTCQWTLSPNTNHATCDGDCKDDFGNECVDGNGTTATCVINPAAL
jgi:hypothetical protein